MRKNWNAELVGFLLGLLEEGLSKVVLFFVWWGLFGFFLFLFLVKGMKLSFQIQNIKQTNSALKEKLEGGIEQYRLPEVGSSSDLCLLWR